MPHLADAPATISVVSSGSLAINFLQRAATESSSSRAEWPRRRNWGAEVKEVEEAPIILFSVDLGEPAVEDSGAGALADVDAVVARRGRLVDPEHEVVSVDDGAQLHLGELLCRGKGARGREENQPSLAGKIRGDSDQLPPFSPSFPPALLS